MITYSCDGCGKVMDQKEYEKKQSFIEGKYYCNSCRPKIEKGIKGLQDEKQTRLAAVETWYQDEVQNLIGAQAVMGMAKSVIKEGG